MIIRITTDSPSWSKVSEISKELRTLSDFFEKKYSHLKLELLICLRCLSSDVKRESFARYSAKDSILSMDISMDENLFMSFKKDKNGQRYLIGQIFIKFFDETIKKYEKKYLT